jgi:predicted glycoside hydrolase/deacetylase ChbG (UPF0249 family)
MVRAAAAEEAAEYAGRHPTLAVGLHVDLGEWVPVGRHEWRAVYEVVSLEDETAVADEVERQLESFAVLVGSEPTHLDSHQHVHLREPVRSVLRRTAARLDLPLRHFNANVRYCGDFYGQWDDGSSHPEAISADALIGIIGRLPPGVSELACHPGDDPDLPSPYRDERLLEVAALCDPRVRATLAEARVELTTFAELAS